MNDCYPGMKTKFMGEFIFEPGQQIFLDEFPMGKKTYRTIRWGKEQMDWFKKTVKESDATFRVLISPTPIVSPDRGSKDDNHANDGFKYEVDMLRKFISEQKNMVTVCGARHWQYISKDAETGLLEFSCGPGADAHAGGWKQQDKLPEHIYLNVAGGFLEGSVSQIDGVPALIFKHYNPDGKLLNEYVVKKE